MDTFRSGRRRGTEAAILRAAFRERFCRYDDGNAAHRTPAPSPAPGRTRRAQSRNGCFRPIPGLGASYAARPG
ncbi:hypothetical protein ABS735_30310 [Streptomyces sp. MMCC 100]|uniref:hypothetical protein n=1 Tax=Streptomyces sp. MMCC 100 TaxID=3163555 RepID=UPI0035996188